MSIYSGFATRNQQQYYDHILYNTISTLLMRINKFYLKQIIEENNFMNIIAKQVKILKKMEKRKYLQPKYAQLIEYFLNMFQSQADYTLKSRVQHLHRTPKNAMSRTFSALGEQFMQLKIGAEYHMDKIKTHQTDHYKLQKIQQKPRKLTKKRQQKSYPNKIALNSHPDLLEHNQDLFRGYTVQHSILTKSKFKQKKQHSFSYNTSNVLSRQSSERGQKGSIENETVLQQRKALLHPPKFRAKMFVR